MTNIIDSLFFAMRMNTLTKIASQISQVSPGNKEKENRLLRITGKSWVRHWKRVQKAIDQGEKSLTIPERLLDENGRFDERLLEKAK